MKAMIFAAGLGTRLKPFTDNMPKAMVPVDGKPLLWHAIRKLKNSGFDEIIINVHHFADQIIDYVKENDNFGIRIEFSDEREQLLDTGGGIKKASRFFDDGKPFLIHNVDIFSNIDLNNFYNRHAGTDAISTLLVSKRETSRYLLFDDDDHLKGWVNKTNGEVKSSISGFHPGRYHQYAFSGIHLLSPRVFKLMDAFPDRFSIIDFYVSISSNQHVRAYHPDNLELLDVGKPEALVAAKQFLERSD